MHAPARELREKIAAGRAVVGAMLVEFFGPAVVGVTADAGFEFILLDCEHGNANPREVEAAIESGLQCGICTIVRPPSVDRGMITRSLDCGAAGVLIPFCSTLEEVRQVVRMTKYTPLGQRGVHLLRGHTRHGRPDPATFMAEANRDLLTIVQIELDAALKQVEEIAAIDGVDGLYIGPADLSADLGLVGQWKAPRVQEAIRRTADACRTHRKIMGCHINDVRDTSLLRELNVQMLGYSCDIGMFQAAAKDVISGFANALGQPRATGSQ